MNTLVAYLIVIAVWATTPLGIKWSGEALPAFAAAGSRMAIAAALNRDRAIKIVAIDDAERIKALITARADIETDADGQPARVYLSARETNK